MLNTLFNRTLFFLIFIFISVACIAQNNKSLIDAFTARIDSLVNDSLYRSNDDIVKSSPVYIKMLSSPVLYNSVLERAFGSGFNSDIPSGSEVLATDAKRSEIIDKMLLNVYKEHPSKIQITEEQLRSEHSVPSTMFTEEIVKMDIAPSPVVDIPENVEGGLKTTVKKPNYWRTSGSFDLKFTQNYVSSNWAQGGENNRMMLSMFVLNLNYDDKNRITFTNKFDATLGFATMEADTLHKFKTNNDKLRLESTFGYKLIKNFDVTAKTKFETQALPNYPTNSYNFVSKFMAPFDATFSLGINYKPKWKDFSLEIFLAPLSAYNYRYVRYKELVARYGIRDTRHHKEDFGTQLIVTIPSAKLFKIVEWESRAELYTDYARTFFSWENKFKVKLNRFFSIDMLFHARFDDSSYELKDESHGYWQYKEYMTLGLSYSW